MAQELAVTHARRIHALDPRELRDIFSDVVCEPYTTVQALAWGSYVPVAQVRKTFQDIEHLAKDIALRGMLNPQTVFAFPLPVAERYVRAVNVMWGSNHTIADLPRGTFRDEPVCFILIAGERRFRALHQLWMTGCERCRETHGNESEGTCFSRHFPHALVPVNLKVGFTPYDALTDQFAENTHHRPQPAEEAVGFRVFYELMRVREPTLEVSAFARRIGHNPERVRAALRYTTLPEFIQEAVTEGKIPYSSALALERYHRERASEDELRYWLQRAIAEAEMSAHRLEELLREDIQHWRSSQLGLFGSAVNALEKTKTRAVFDTAISRALDRINGFLSHAVNARKNGLIGDRYSPFASGSIAHAGVRIYDLLDGIVPAIRGDLTRQEQKRIEGTRNGLNDDITWIRERTDDTDVN